MKYGSCEHGYEYGIGCKECLQHNEEKKEGWERSFGIHFITKENGENEPTVHCNPEYIKDFIRQQRLSARQEGIEYGLSQNMVYFRQRREISKKAQSEIVKEILGKQYDRTPGEKDMIVDVPDILHISKERKLDI